MEFSEAGLPWGETPPWAHFMVEFGYRWPFASQPAGRRRIALISMPCDSAAAGLVALGALRRFLESPDANDVSQHLQRLQRMATGESVTFRHCRVNGVFVFHSMGDDGFWVTRPTTRTQEKRFVSLKNAVDWRVQDEPFVELLSGRKLPHGAIHRDLISQGGKILDGNLCKTHSGLCLAGRAMGKTETRTVLKNIRFRDDTEDAGLDELLAVHGWSGEMISRTLFLNSRTRRLDRQTMSPSLVVADGPTPFLTVVDDHDLAGQSDIVAVLDRTMERDQAEMIGQRMADMGQWYVRDESLAAELSAAPRGISVATWRGR